MKTFAPLLASAGLQAILSGPAIAQDSAAPPVQPTAANAASTQPADEENGDDEIVVVGQRDPNAAIGDIPPENSLSSRDIRAYGASSVAELLSAIAPQTQSGRGRDSGAPVVLLNGKRTSGFREIRDIPPEAIQRLDILPEEVALKYGYRADQRVVNIILRRRFRSTAARAEATVPTEGGRVAGQGDVTRFMVQQDGRMTLNAHAEGQTPLLESERDIAFAASDPAAVDPRPLRTLQGSRSAARVGGTLNRTLFGDVSTTFDGQVEATSGRSLLGPSRIEVGEALARENDALSGRAGLAMNGELRPWRWSVTGAYEVARSTSQTDRESESLAAFNDRSRSLSRTGNLDLVANGPLVQLPTGKANLTVRLGADTRDLDSRSERLGVERSSDLGRGRLSSSVNFDLPISKRNTDFSAIGNLTLNANAGVDRLSDFGTLTTIGAGLFWSPATKLNLIGSWTREEGAPSLNQLGDPVLATPGTRVFDFATGQTVLADVVTGGNPDLLADRRSVWKLGGTFRPSTKLDLEIRADYTRSQIKDPVASFPGPTPAIEAAFPDRFTRDSQGNLVRVDLRPVNFQSSARDEFRWGFNFSKPLTTARPSQATLDQLREQFRQRSGNAPPPTPPGGGREGGGEGNRQFGGQGGGGFRGGFGGGGGPFGGGGRGGRLQLSAYHTIMLKDEAVIRPGLPRLDYLDGEAGSSGGGTSRHRVQVDGGYFNNGLGLRASADWRSGSDVTGGEAGTLHFSPLARFNLSAFANLGERADLIVKHPWMRGMQLRLALDNLFDAKQKVRDATGTTPVNYQPDLVDPLGRTISISIRKLFFPPPQFFRRQQGAQGQQGAPAAPAPEAPPPPR